MTIIAQFRASSEFTQCASSSQRAYRTYIKLIEDKFGDLPLAALSDKRIRGEFKTWRDAPAEIELALIPALWTGQRRGDLPRLPWSAYDGTHIRLRQSKTGRRSLCP
jgi:hypothetical protein